MIFPLPKVKYEIARKVYEKKKIMISSLITGLHIAPQSGYRYITELLQAGVLREEREGSKPTLRYLFPNFSSTGNLLFSLIEEERRLFFLQKHPELRGPLEQFSREISFGVIFGSFARGGETKESDLDLLVIGKKSQKRKLERICERCFVTVKHPISLRLAEKKEFIAALNKKDAFALQVLQDHVVISGSLEWVSITGTRVDNAMIR